MRKPKDSRQTGEPRAGLTNSPTSHTRPPPLPLDPKGLKGKNWVGFSSLLLARLRATACRQHVRAPKAVGEQPGNGGRKGPVPAAQFLVHRRDRRDNVVLSPAHIRTLALLQAAKAGEKLIKSLG